MRTVKDYLLETETDKLIDNYLEKYPLKVDDLADKIGCIKEVEQRMRGILAEYIDQLRVVEADDSGSEYIVCGYREWNGESIETAYMVVGLQELLKNGLNARRELHWHFDQKQYLSFKVSSDEYTQKHLEALLAYVLFIDFRKQKREYEREKELQTLMTRPGWIINRLEQEVEERNEYERLTAHQRELRRTVWSAKNVYNDYERKATLIQIVKHLNRGHYLS